MGKIYQDKIFVFDMDGTLLKPLNFAPEVSILSQENKQFLAGIILGGGRIVLGSGHSLTVFDKLVAQQAEFMKLPLSAMPFSFIARNGAIIKAGNSVIKDVRIPVKTVAGIEAVVREVDKAWETKGITERSAFAIATDITPYITKKVSGWESDATMQAGEQFVARMFGNTAKFFNNNKPEDKKDYYVYYANEAEYAEAARRANQFVMFSINADKMKDLFKLALDKFGAELEFFDPVQLVPKGVSKAGSLDELLQVIDPLARCEVVAIGDDSRDLNIITYNSPELKKRCKSKLGFAIRSLNKDGTVKNQEILDAVGEDRVVNYVWEMEEALTWL
ncbi:MAG: HAD family hydrolase [Firmicutes bacterium]|nr:HAD family hydrolase [Bacillota bacterium]